MTINKYFIILTAKHKVLFKHIFLFRHQGEKMSHSDSKSITKTTTKIEQNKIHQFKDLLVCFSRILKAVIK